MNGYDEMMAALLPLKEKFGSPMAKEVILLSGASRAVEVHPAYQRTVQRIAEKMVAANSQKEAAEILIAQYRDACMTPSNYLCELAHMPVASPSKAAPPEPKLPSPNEVIQWLLEIAAAGADLIAWSELNDGASGAHVPRNRYEHLADKLAALEALPHVPGRAQGAARAAEYLKTFTSGFVVTRDSTNDPETAAKLAAYIKTHGIPEPTGSDTLWGFPVVMQATADAVLVGESTERIRRGTPMGKAPQTIGLHRDFRAEQFDKIVHAYHQTFDPIPAAISAEEITSEVIEFIYNSSKMNIPHGHPVTIGAPCAIYEVAYVDNLLNAVADLATDGKRFRTLSWMFKCEETISNSVDGLRQAPQFSDYARACEIMEGLDSNNMDEFGPALDAVRRAGLVPDSNDKLDSAAEAEGLRVKALELARHMVDDRNYVEEGTDVAVPYCVYCQSDLADDPLAETHEPGCPVITARQLIEDQS